MNDWTAGYVADIAYTYGYYSELNPLRARFAFLNAGQVCPEIGSACELGYGQGMSANIHAAASSVQWVGTDFNPMHACLAQELATAAGLSARLYDDAFADFCTRSDLPDFDFIALHGIWSWVSDENRRCIVDFVRRKLKVGGVLYISYNTMPGWAAFGPVRHLMRQHADVLGTKGLGLVGHVDGALAFVEKLFALNPMYLRANPTVAERLRGLKIHNRTYLAHEYFNDHWQPMHFKTTAQWLEQAKLTYACSATHLDHIDGINMSAEQQGFLAEIPDATFRETVRDYLTNQQFRRDYWVKGPRRMSALQQAEAIRQQRVVLLTHRPDVPLKVMGAMGEAAMSEQYYAPVLDLMADHQCRTVAQIEQAVADKSISFGQLIQSLMVLSGAGHLMPAQDEQAGLKAKKSTDRLNAAIINKSRGSADLDCLASPVIGGGVTVNRVSQLFLAARAQGYKLPQEWAQQVWLLLDSQKQRLLKEGKTLETAEDNLAQLNLLAKKFLEKELPILKSLKIA